MKILYSYVIEVADSESDFGFTIKIKFRRYLHYTNFRKMHFVDQDVVAMYTLYLIIPAP